MSGTGYQAVLVTAPAAGVALNTFTAAATLLPTPAIYTLPSNYFYYPGQMMRITATGIMSSFTSGTFTLNLGMGPTLASPISVWTPPAMTVIVSLTNITWRLDLDLVVRSVGSGTAATILGVGKFTSAILTGGQGGAGILGGWSQMLPMTAPAVGSGFDSTVTNIVNLFCACSVSNAANAIQLLTYTLESLN
jgi:hypothetical protein